ncbi:DUF2087 domain-containing protein [Cohnella abietis]|uniref:Transcriptional regulator n=1 Tax=Cohnella abietis TaxID=2507935 RepID=A0A3T1D6R3_9BACL|nr:DUF2087 domain-containing protein [Cohnella abietis]BBI33749.1 transcriptional regulator [Cohnella abietis]
MDVSEAFWNSSLEELKQGYIREPEYFVCLLCGKRTEMGVIYPVGSVYYDAEKFMRKHIEGSHHSVFDYLIGLDKKLTGLTEHQNSLLQLFHQGKSDNEIQQEMGIGSSSTIRNHRFVLKEKERQSKVFLVLMELLKEKDQHAPTIVNVHTTAKMIDDRYNVTQDEVEKVLKKYFPEGTEGALTTFSMKEKYKLIVLREIAKRFVRDTVYTEKEVNQILIAVFDDHVTLRRYLIEYGFLDRKSDGSQYWLKE